MMVLVNRMAGGGRAGYRWRQVEPRLREKHNRMSIVYLEDDPSVRRSVRSALDSGETDFLAAGGDGTVNILLNSLLREKSENACGLRLGAIGLGSSNDFHKPLSAHSAISGVPVRWDFDNALMRDVGVLTAATGYGVRVRYFLLNASIGIAAEGNAFFNRPDRMLGILKRYSTASAIGYSAVRSILRHDNIRCTVSSPGVGDVVSDITYAAVIKNPNISGGLHFRENPSYNDGSFSIYCYQNLNRIDLLCLSWSMLTGVPFRKNLRKWKSSSLRITAETPFVVEYDGEILSTADVRFSVLPRLLGVCS